MGQYNILPDSSSNLQIAHAMENDTKLSNKLIDEIQTIAASFTDTNSSLHAKHILCVHAALHGTFVEPTYINDLLDLSTTNNIKIRQSILWAFASAISCASILSPIEIEKLFYNLNNPALGWNVSFIFRKLSEDEEHIKMISDDQWISISNLLCNSTLDEQVRLNILYTMINIFNNNKKISNQIKIQLEKLITSDDIPKKLLITTVKALHMMVIAGMPLDSGTLNKLRELMKIDHDTAVEFIRELLDFLDDKHIHSKTAPHRWNINVQREIVATQTISVSHSEEKVIEPTIKFLSLDHMFDRLNQFNQLYDTETEPLVVDMRKHTAWYRTPMQDLKRLHAIAKKGELGTEDFRFLLEKMKDGSRHWFILKSRDSVYEMIANIFLDAVRCGQTLPHDVIAILFYRLTNESTKLNRTYAECLLHVARRQTAFTDEQRQTIEQIMEKTKDSEVRQTFLQMYALCVSQGHHINVNLVSIEQNLLNNATCIEASFLFLKVAAVEKRIFTRQQMKILSEIGKSNTYPTKAREQSLFALAYSIKEMTDKRSISMELITCLGDILKDENENIRYSAAVTLCFYAKDNNDINLSKDILDRLAMMLYCDDDSLVNNILLIYLNLVKQKKLLSSFVLDNIAGLIVHPQFDHRYNTIWILKYAVDNDQILSPTLLDTIEYCFNDEYPIRNTAANTFIEYWDRQWKKNDNDNMRNMFSNRMENLLIVFQNPFEIQVQNSTLAFVNDLVEKNFELSDSFLSLIECCLCNNELSIVTNAINVLMSYMKQNSISQRTIVALENVLITDTKILADVITILKIAVGKGNRLSDKSLVFLGNLLSKSDDPLDIVLLLTFTDRQQPLPSNVNGLLRQHYYVDVLRNSNCKMSLDKAYNGLLSLTTNGHLLSRLVLDSLFFLLRPPNQHLSLLSIIVHVTINGQHLINDHIHILTDILFIYENQPLIDLIYIFKEFSRQNHAIPDVIISCLRNYLTNSSINIYIIEIYRHLIEREKSIDPEIIKQILQFLDASTFANNSPELQQQVIAFYSALAHTQPIEADQEYLPFLLDLNQSLFVRKDACLIVTTLIELDQILTPAVIEAIIHLWNHDNNIDVKRISLNILKVVCSETSLLNLTHCINTTTDEDFLKTSQITLAAGFKLQDEHLKRLSTMLYSCVIDLKYEASKMIVRSISNGQILLNQVLHAIYATLRDETINSITIPLLFESTSSLPSIIMNDLLYVAIHSSQTIVRENARRILQVSITNPNVKQFFEYKQYLHNINRSRTTKLGEDDHIKHMLWSSNDHEVRTGLMIVRSRMFLEQRRLSSDLLMSVVVQLGIYDEIAGDILIPGLKNEIELNNDVCDIIEDVFTFCRTKKIVILIQILAMKRYIFKSETLDILFTMLNKQITMIDDLYMIFDYAAQHQLLSKQIIIGFMKQLSQESNEIVQKSFGILRHQILQGYIENSVELWRSIRLPRDINPAELFDQLETFEQCLGTIYTLLFIDYFDSKILDLHLPAEQWSRECLCVDLLANCSNITSNQVVTFYHQLTQFEQYKKYKIYSDDRDRILRALILKQRIYALDLSIINQVFIYLKTLTDVSIEILLMNDSNWLINMRKYFVRDQLNERLSRFMYSEAVIDHLVDRISQEDNISADLIEYFLRIVRQPQDILAFLDILSKYQITQNELVKLFAQTDNNIDFELFLNQMKSISLRRTFLSNCTGSKEQLERSDMYLNNLLEQGWTFETINEMLMNVKVDVESSERLNQLNECLKMLLDYKIDGTVVSQLTKIFSNKNSSLWSTLVHKLIIDYRFVSKYSEKTIATLLNEIQRYNALDLTKGLTDKLKMIDEAFESDSSILQQNDTIKHWKESKISLWAMEISRRSSEQFVQDHLHEVMAVIKRAIHLDSNFEPRHIQLIAVLIILDPHHYDGRLLQILTGEGKSTIVAILAVIKALQGKQVDIVTSSITLAKRDAHERKQFYKMFNLTVSHNNDERSYVKGPKFCYQDNIVYGTSSQFQFDILRHDFSLLNTRENRRYDIVIIDEVDSMLIDENNTIARLADELPGMEWLNPLLYNIWESIQIIPNSIEKRDTIVAHSKQLLCHTQYQWEVPCHLKNFILDSIPSWIDHAILAKVEYRLDHHYIIKSDEKRTKRILPIDYSNTGVIQCNTTWSDGLHQFLQIKHGLKVTPISITTNYLSNIGLFSRYKNQIYGFTGTLGSKDARELLSKIYHVDTIIIPSFKEKRHFSFKPILALTDDDWLYAIVSTTIEHVIRKRAVLIICETRLDAKTIVKALRRKHWTSSIRFYTDNTDDIELNVVSNRIKQSDIIVATNLAGRGTDLKTSQEIENHGGLHICLTYLPNNLRVEEQAFGRTSRQGNRGTSQMILNRDRTSYQLKYAYPEYLEDQHKPLNDYSIDSIRHCREKAESACLNRIWKEEIPNIKEKDELFQQFCILLNKCRQQNNDNYQLLSVKEQWGLW